MFFVSHGSLDNPKSMGTNNLIKEFAEIVTEPEDILKKYEIIASKIEETNLSLIGENIDIPEEYKKIYQFIGKTPISIDELIRKSKLNLKEVMQKLTMLELEGKINKISGNRYIRGE